MRGLEPREEAPSGGSAIEILSWNDPFRPQALATGGQVEGLGVCTPPHSPVLEPPWLLRPAEPCGQGCEGPAAPTLLSCLGSFTPSCMLLGVEATEFLHTLHIPPSPYPLSCRLARPLPTSLHLLGFRTSPHLAFTSQLPSCWKLPRWTPPA